MPTKKEDPATDKDRADLVRVGPGQVITRSLAEDKGLLDEDGSVKPAELELDAAEVTAGDGRSSLASLAGATNQSVAGVKADLARAAAEDGRDPQEFQRETHKVEGKSFTEAVGQGYDPGRQSQRNVQAVLDDALVRGIIEKPLDAKDYKSAAIREDVDGIKTLFTGTEDGEVEATTVIDPRSSRR
jgi:hypothetical protein